jgi:hypothetical protein
MNWLREDGEGDDGQGLLVPSYMPHELVGERQLLDRESGLVDW